MTLEAETLHPCQSCGLLMKDQQVWGTNLDGTKNGDYCYFCFRNGSFTMPSITMERMIEKVANMISMKKNIALVQSRQIAASTIPCLARWRDKTC